MIDFDHYSASLLKNLRIAESQPHDKRAQWLLESLVGVVLSDGLLGEVDFSGAAQADPRAPGVTTLTSEVCTAEGTFQYRKPIDFGRSAAAAAYDHPRLE